MNSDIFQPSNVPLTVDSRLRIVSTSNVGTNSSAIITTRMMLPSGEIVEIPSEVTILGETQGQVYIQQLTKGVLLGVSVRMVTITLRAGQIFASINLQEGKNATESRIQTLTSGEVTSAKPLVYPLSVPATAEESTGSTNAVLPAEPGAGVELGYSPASVILFSLLGGSFQLTTDGNVAVRTVQINLTKNLLVIFNAIARTTQIAGLTRTYVLWRGAGLPTDSSTFIYLPIPSEFPATDVTFNTITNNLQIGDTFTNIQLMTNWRVNTY